ncbi:MAG: hypothetical protein M3R59_02030 [Verrucomicrobiota bacterium]|nr:hypothetical protein [Verrucomicrobiota bacterium]
MRAVVALLVVGGVVSALASCVSTNAPPGVKSAISFTVAPVYPRSFDITAIAPRYVDETEMREAWQKKAEQVAAGRKFTVSRMTARKTEESASLALGRVVTGTMTLAE